MDNRHAISHLWQPRIEARAGPKYLGIVEALSADLRSGLIGPGDRLPAQRAVARALGVDLTTVTRGFNLARERGLIDATTGKGSFISKAADAASADALAVLPAIDLSMNIPPQPEAAELGRRMTEAVDVVLARAGGMAHLHYQASGGSEPDRSAGASWLGQRIAALSPERVLLAGGCQSALFAICHTLARIGDATIATGAVTYPGIQAVAGSLGLKLAGLAMDADGIVPESFEDECNRRKPKALYVIPAIDNPTTATLPKERRLRIVEIARRHDVAIIEDDPYSRLMQADLPSFASLARELTWHVATLSKCVTPALRIAYVVAPDKASADKLSDVLRATSLMAPPLMAAVTSRWIGSGVIGEITEAIRTESTARQEIARTVLADFPFQADPNGHHLWLRLPGHWRAVEFAYHAERSGLSVVPSSAFAISSPAPEAVRVSLGAASKRSVLGGALGLLNDLLSRPSLSARAVV